MATVLIVEDEAQLRRGLARYLACRGFTVVEADTVETTIEALKAYVTPFDVILLDINLPDGTGWDVLRYLRDRVGVRMTASGAQWQPRVIAMTAAQPAQCRLDEFELAAFLLKPFPMEVLVRLLDHVLSQRPCAGTADTYESSQSHAGCTGAAEDQDWPTYALGLMRDDVELDVEDAFGDHGIEYWARHGNRLVPATDDEVAQIHEWERESSALARLSLWEHQHARAGSRFAHLLRGVERVRQRLGHSSHQLPGGVTEQRKPPQRPRIKRAEARTRPARD